MKLGDILKPMTDAQLCDFSAVHPDFMFTIGDTRARMLQLAKSVGLDDKQLAALEKKLEGQDSPPFIKELFVFPLRG